MFWTTSINMIWKTLLGLAATLAYIFPALGAPSSGLGLASRSTDKYVFAHFMVSQLFPGWFEVFIVYIHLGCLCRSALWKTTSWQIGKRT
jgi:hypothetical protein